MSELVNQRQLIMSRKLTVVRVVHVCFILLIADDLHWLTIPQRAQHKLAVTIHRSLRYRAPRYLADCCMPVFEVSSSQRLWLAVANWIFYAFLQHIWHQAFSSLTFWNSLSDSFLIRPSSLNILGRTWKRISLPYIKDMNESEMSPFRVIALYKSEFTCLFVCCSTMQIFYLFTFCMKFSDYYYYLCDYHYYIFWTFTKR